MCNNYTRIRLTIITNVMVAFKVFKTISMLDYQSY